MRVTCESCGAQYNLPDGKVRGRKAKVRCKRCSASIVVDGTSLAPGQGPDEGSEEEEEDEATQVMQSPMSALSAVGDEDGGDDDPNSWTVNLSDDDQRTMTTEEIVAGWTQGEVTNDAFVWKDGMTDWSAIMDVPELASAIGAAGPGPGAPAPAAPRPPTPATTTAAARTGQARPATFDLFGPPRSLQRDSMTEPRRAPSPPKATATANENSVVFSLEALKAAAGQSEKPTDSRASEDLLTLGDSMASPLNAPLIEVIPQRPISPIAEASAAPAAAPLTMQQAPPEKKTPIWIYAAAGAAVLGLGFFGGRMMMGDPGAAEGPATARTASPDTSASAAGTSDGAEEAKDEKKDDEAEKAETQEKKDDEEADKDKAQDDDKSDSKQVADSTKGGSSDSSGSSNSGSSNSGSSSSGGSSDSSGSSKSGSSSSGGSSKKESGGAKFSVAAAKGALSAAAVRAKSCKKPDGPTGSGKVQVTFATSGRVTSANVVSGPFGGTSVGGCVARTFRGARVPSFEGSPVTVAKSFSIK